MNFILFVIAAFFTFYTINGQFFVSQSVGTKGKIINIEKKSVGIQSNKVKRFTIQNQNIAKGASVMNINPMLPLDNKTVPVVTILKRDSNSNTNKRFTVVNQNAEGFGSKIINLEKRSLKTSLNSSDSVEKGAKPKRFSVGSQNANGPNTKIINMEKRSVSQEKRFSVKSQNANGLNTKIINME